MARDSRVVCKEARRLLRKQGHRLKESVADQIARAIGELAHARKIKDTERTCDRMEKVDRLLQRHLAFARKSAFREYTESIGIAVIIALLLRAFVVEAFKIPSGSMIPTLKVGDHIFVNKFTYGLRIPLTHKKFFSRKPERGDVIVFIYPKDESKDFIKRIVAIGGDVVQVRDGVISVNGEIVTRRELPTSCAYAYIDTGEGRDEEIFRRCVAYAEEVNGTKYRVVEDDDAINLDEAPFRVPEGHVFVMGDNRNNSSDSRAWGTVPEDHIKGKAMIIWWSRGRPDGVRWRRFFRLVHAFDPEEPIAPVPDT